MLDDVWACAPDLRNGSVPTMRQLLVPDERPATFLRAVMTTMRPGWEYAWTPAQIGRLSNAAPTLILYDTRRDDDSNRGYDRDVVLEGKLLRLNRPKPKRSWT